MPSKKQPGMLVIIVLAVAGFMTFGSLVTGMIITGAFRGGELDKARGAGYGYGEGCFLGDRYFTDTSIADSPEVVLGELKTAFPNSADKETYIRQVLEKGRELGLNPALPLAIWNGEQSFNSPEKAFGYGFKDSGTVDGAHNWEYQLEGVYRSLGKTVSITSPYDKPDGTNRFTRLFYNYTTAMREAYLKAGNRWVEGTEVEGYGRPVDSRMSVLKRLVPQQIECVAGRNTPAIAAQGAYAPPIKGLKKDMIKPHHDNQVAVDLAVVTGTEVFALVSGTITGISRDSNTYGFDRAGLNPQQRCGVGFAIEGEDGRRYNYCHMLELDSNIREGFKVQVGSFVGLSDNTGRSSGAHLHLGASGGGITAEEFRELLKSLADD